MSSYSCIACGISVPCNSDTFFLAVSKLTALNKLLITKWLYLFPLNMTKPLDPYMVTIGYTLWLSK